MYSNLVRTIDCDQGAIRKIRHSKDGEYCVRLFNRFNYLIMIRL